jgi:hypothetical protein
VSDRLPEAGTTKVRSAAEFGGPQRLGNGHRSSDPFLIAERGLSEAITGVSGRGCCVSNTAEERGIWK